MSLVGKILLFVNLLAAAGLVYLTAQDYAKRRDLNATALQYRLLIDGLPVDEPPADSGDDIPINVSVVPGHRTPTVSKGLLEKHLSAGGVGGLVKSQVEAVKALKQKMEANVANLNGDGEKVRFLCGATVNGIYSPGLLMKYAETYEERAAIRDLANTTDPSKLKAAYEDAAARLSRKFSALLNAPNPPAAAAESQKLVELQGKAAQGDKAAMDEAAALDGQGAPPYTRDETDRRVRIAKILMLESSTSADQKRVMYLVGMRAYARGVADLTARMSEVARRTERQLELDQQRFQDEYEMLKRLAQEQDQLLYQQLRVVAGLQEQAKKDTEAVNVRTAQLAAIKTELNAINEQVAALLTAQAKVEGELHAVQQKVGDTLVNNFGLEDKLIQAEKGKR